MSVPVPDLSREKSCIDAGAVYVAGMDEVGRGALAGPVMVGVVVVDAGVVTRGDIPVGLADSKLITERRRVALCEPITSWCVASAIGHADAYEIDQHGIMAALQLAGVRALSQLPVTPDVVILDGPHNWLSPHVAHVIAEAKADQHCASVAAASVLAKVTRDQLMVQLHERFPQYGWASNKGYGAKVHKEAISQTGASEMHRKSWNLS